MKPQQTLPHTTTPWLFAAAAVTTAPHALHQPLWLTALSGLCLLWAINLWWRDQRLPGRWLLIGLVFLGCLGIFFEYRTLFGRDAGVAALVMLIAMKLLEVRSRRDGMVLIVLGYFLLLTHYFYSQDIPTGLWLLFALWVVTASLIRLQAPEMTTRENLRQAARFLLQALPLMLLLYLLFPRVSGPLWGLPKDAFSGKTGLSDSMSPGSIANLVQSGEIAFRVRFADAPPPKQKLYWRGPVLERFDGTTWRPSPLTTGAAQVEIQGPSIEYEMTLEAHGQRWLLALDAPVQLPTGATLDSRLTVLQTRPVETRQRLVFTAATTYQYNLNENPATLAENLRLPRGSNPQTQALAKRWRETHQQPEAVVSAALRHFREEAFYYTLQPPLLGPQGVDDFLFRSRRGFCEHYAAAFVVLMRHAGIPARVVGGYQGGEINPRDGFLVVRQSDAHAWTEVWLENRGWVRADPTAAVAPERIEQGVASALPVGDPLPAFIREHGHWLRDLRHRWEALNNAWNQQVLGYDARRQRELLSRLGLPDADWRTLAIALGLSATLLMLLLTWWTLRQRPKQAAESLYWQKALRKTRIQPLPAETPLALLERLRQEQPELARTLSPVVHHFLLAHYAPEKPEHLNALRLAVHHLRLPGKSPRS